jgi:hypothetical protein
LGFYEGVGVRDVKVEELELEVLYTVSTALITARQKYVNSISPLC